MSEQRGYMPIETFELVGGRLCLDFTNTIGCYFVPETSEKLRRYEDLLIFARRVGMIAPDVERALAKEAANHPADAERIFADAHRLRDALFTLFYPDRPDRDEALSFLNRQVAVARAHQVLVTTDGGFGFAFRDDEVDLERPLWPIALSAAELLTSPSLERVRACSNHYSRCTWLFVDESKNRSRRWCSMRDCGNRVKAKRHYEKKRDV
jgi:predicted RNA-binding Zn ribbon-like protein